MAQYAAGSYGQPSINGHGMAAIGLDPLLIGVPLGVVAGNWAWSAFANSVGIASRSTVPLWLILLAIPVTLLLANAIATFPGVAAPPRSARSNGLLLHPPDVTVRIYGKEQHVQAAAFPGPVVPATPATAPGKPSSGPSRSRSSSSPS